MKNGFEQVKELLQQELISRGLKKRVAQKCSMELMKKLFGKSAATIYKWLNNELPSVQYMSSLLKKIEKGEKNHNERFTDILYNAIKKYCGTEDDIENEMYDWALEFEENDFYNKLNILIKKIYNVKFKRGLSIWFRIYLCVIFESYNNIFEEEKENISFIERNINFQNVISEKFIWVIGPAYSGKTNCVFEYARINKKPIIYCERVTTYEQVLDKIRFDYEEILNKCCWLWDYLDGIHANSTEEKIKRNKNPFVLLIEGDQLEIDEINKLKELSKVGNIQIFVEKRKSSEKEEYFPTIQIKSFTKRECAQLFYTVGERKRKRQIEVDERRKIEGILPEILVSVCYNPALIILIAENFWNRIAGDENSAFGFLKSLINFEPIGNHGEKLVGTKGYSVIDKEHKNYSLQKHIRVIFAKAVPEIQKSIFYLLALLNDLTLSVRHICGWFKIEEKDLKNLEKNGWCIIKSDVMKIHISKFVISAFNYDDYKSVTEAKELKRCIRELALTLDRKEVNPIDIEVMQQVILRLHNVIFIQLKGKKTLLDQTMCYFHFSCVKYFEVYGNAVYMDELNTYTKTEEFKECQDMMAYEKVLNNIRWYMQNNNISDLPDDICHFVKLYSMNNSEFTSKAFEEIFDLIIEKSIVMYVCDNMKPWKNVDVMQKISDLIALGGLTKFPKALGELRREQTDRVEFYNKYLDYFFRSVTGGAKKSLVDEIRQFEDEYLQKIEQNIGKEITIADIENKIMFRSFTLLLYANLYVNKTCCIGTAEKKEFYSRIFELEKLKNCINGVPLNCLEMYFTAMCEAKYILGEEFDVRKGDLRLIVPLRREDTDRLEVVKNQYKK